MTRDQMLEQLKNGDEAAQWAAREIEAIDSHAGNLATGCAFACGALPTGSLVTDTITSILLDYNHRFGSDETSPETSPADLLPPLLRQAGDAVRLLERSEMSLDDLDDLLGSVSPTP